jgi:hypothetical protein
LAQLRDTTFFPLTVAVGGAGTGPGTSVQTPTQNGWGNVYVKSKKKKKPKMSESLLGSFVYTADLFQIGIP